MSKRLKLIAFNGPPGVGKDYATEVAEGAVDQCRGWLPLSHKMSAPLKRIIPALLNTTHHQLEADKDKKLLSGLNTTYRQAQIDASEKYLKAVYGRNIFGKLAVNEIIEEYNRKLYEAYNVCILISDCGFAYELDHLIEWVGAKNCKLIQLYRDDYDFTGDSRSYVTIPGVLHTGIYNNGTTSFDEAITDVVGDFLHD